jgi:lipopolysaccharide/colanic/teichoic acid biosynthesis glycosyltransferase
MRTNIANSQCGLQSKTDRSTAHCENMATIRDQVSGNAKRGLDLLFSFSGIVLLAPIIAVLAALVWFDSGRPVFFCQNRVGRGGREFRMFKLRTMRARAANRTGTFEPGDTSRVTRLGKILRATKLDELPQLWNVLVGDMSLVGPRPEVRSWVNVYPDRWARVHVVRPGLTDPAALLYWDEESLLASAEDPEQLYRDVVLPRKLELYEQYIANRTFAGDVWLILKTPVVLAARLIRRRASISSTARVA